MCVQLSSWKKDKDILDYYGVENINIDNKFCDK